MNLQIGTAIGSGRQHRQPLHRPVPTGLSSCLRPPHHGASIPGRAAVVTHLMTSTSSNPAFTYGKVEDAIYETGRAGPPMTMDGAVHKTGLLLAVATATAAATWMQILTGNFAAAMAASKISGVVALVAAMATMFKPQWAMCTSLVFSAAKGVALGGFSAMLEVMYPGIVLNALMLTFGTAGSLLVAYQSRLIKVTDTFRDGVIMVTGGYFLTLLVGWVVSMLGVKLPSMLSAGPVGIGLGLLAASLAAANLLLDFDMIRSAARARMPKWFEWYSGFTLMLTLVWMYTEVLRLLMMFAKGKDD